MRIAFALLALFLLATFVPAGLQRQDPLPAIGLVRAEPLTLDPSWPGRGRLGALRFLGAWRLTSNDPRFGGLSAMHVEGGFLFAFSDAGWMLRFPLPGPRSPLKVRIGPLPDGPGSANAKAERDIEAIWMERREAWIAFERGNVVWRFARPGWQAEAHAAPAAMEDWPANRGSEAMVRLGNGRFLIFSEGRGHGGPALLFAGDPAVPRTPAKEFLYRPPAGYRATDAGLLPDGRVLVLNRRYAPFEGFTAKLTVLRLEADGSLAGREVADLRPPLTVDNMEALSVTREGDGTIVWLASDDNYNPLQRTLLMKFALAE